MQRPENVLQIHQFVPFSRANGPGVRSVIWVQGCSLGCPGCFNPETHSFEAGQEVSVDDLFDRISSLGDRIEGITISGGEPFQQSEPLARLLERVRSRTRLSILIFTGFSYEELQKMAVAQPILSITDVLIAGRYVDDKRIARGLKGSSNKTVHLLTDRYTMADIDSVPTAEVIITEDGEIIFSGIDPLNS